MIDAHFTGAAALVLALTALLHAARAALPGIVDALRERSQALRLDAEAHVAAEGARAAAEGDLRDRLDECEARDVATRARADAAELRHAAEIATLRGQHEAMRRELEDLRRSLTAGHSHPR